MTLSRLKRPSLIALSALMITIVLGGCGRPVPQAPEYARPLPPGAFGLRRVTDASQMPDLAAVLGQLRDSHFLGAMDRSLQWYSTPSTRQFFPTGPISHVHAQTSVYALRTMALSDTSTQGLKKLFTEEFDVWESVGWDGSGTVLFTGYYTPVFRASRARTNRYRYPIFGRPPDLVTDPSTGQVHGRQTADGLAIYPARAEIEQAELLAGLELVYLPSRLDAYLIEVNGSAKLQLADGSVLYLGYAGSNGRDYTSIGQLLVEAGKVDRNRLSLPAIRRYFDSHPDELDAYIQRNERVVFFGEYKSGHWPAGSLGFRVTPKRTIATDKSIFPRGCAVLVATTLPGLGGRGRSRGFEQLMLDQDTGGAIRAAGRGDIYLGMGTEAQRLAGRQAAEGRLYYLLLRPQRVQDWYERMARDPAYPQTKSVHVN